MSRFGFERKSKAKIKIFFPTNQSTDSLTPSRKMKLGGASFECMCSWSSSCQKFASIDHLLLRRHLEHSIIERENLIFVRIGFFFAILDYKISQ